MRRPTPNPKIDPLVSENALLRERLEAAEETLRAIQVGDVDALVVDDGDGHRVYTLEGADRPYRLLVEQMHQGAVTLDANGAILYSNPRFGEMAGRTESELVGLMLSAVIASEDRALFKSVLDSLHSGPKEGEVKLKRGDGSVIPVFIAANVLPRDSGAAVGVLITDLTAQKHQEKVDELLAKERSARAEAEAANRMKDEFLATVSHELRTPLNAILGWSTVLRSGRVSSEKTASALETIERNARAQKKLIEDLLDVSRIITGKVRLDIRPIDVLNPIEAAAGALQPAADAKGVRIQKVVDGGVCAVSGDPDRLQQVIWNLLSNAIKFTPTGGRVQVRLERDNSHVAIIVSDTGKGIHRNFLPFVFDRFRQADSAITRSSGGLGLGLAIVRHLVELHGGEVHADSPGEGQGATFTVKLPLIAVYERQTDEQRLQQNAHYDNLLPEIESNDRLDGLSVLAVDDERDTCDLLKAMLERCGARVTAATSAQDALDLLSLSRFDLLISDIGMPGTDGYQLLQAIRQLPPERGGKIPAVALTAYARIEDRLRALRAGYEMHVSKPIEYNELVTVLFSLASRRL